jgi:hypothetical protein
VRVRDGSSVTERSEQDRVLVRPELLRQILDRHTTAGENQAAMVRDLRQGGDRVGR